MTNSGAKRDDIASDLFMALLAVNSWTLEQVGRLYPALQANNLFNVSALSGLDWGLEHETCRQVIELLVAAAYLRWTTTGAVTRAES